MDILIIEHASKRQNTKHGFILVWTNTTGTYEHVVSWQVYTKNQAQDIIKLVVILAYLSTLDFSYTLQNTSATIWQERDNIQIILYTPDQTLMEFYDQDVLDLIEDGFINPHNIHESMLEYYHYLNS